METLKRRQDFIAAAKGVAKPMPCFVIQLRERGDDEGPRLGFTCSKKLGNAVARNRIRRRLKEAARLSLKGTSQSGCDYVIIGRPQAAVEPFKKLQSDLISATLRLHDRARQSKPVEPS